MFNIQVRLRAARTLHCAGCAILNAWLPSWHHVCRPRRSSSPCPRPHACTYGNRPLAFLMWKLKPRMSRATTPLSIWILLRRKIHAGPSIPVGIPLRYLSLYRVSIDLDDRESLQKTILKCTERQNIIRRHQTICT